MAEAINDRQTLFIDPRMLTRLNTIELKSRYIVTGLYNNKHRTRDFGSSNEFIEFREYRWGDEIRNIDWRAFARTGKYYVKLHEMESVMNVYFVLDTSDSMRVASREEFPSKLELAATITGAVSSMAINQQDSVGMVTIGDRVEEFIPCRQGQRHLALLLQHLNRPKGRKGGEFGTVLKETIGRLGRRGMVFVLSDGWDPHQQLFDSLKLLRVQGHDVTFIQVVDRDELTFPFDQMTEFENPETRGRIKGDPIAMKTRYLERIQSHLDTIERFCKTIQVDYLQLDNSSDLLSLLSLHFLKRLTGGV